MPELDSSERIARSTTLPTLSGPSSPSLSHSSSLSKTLGHGKNRKEEKKRSLRTLNRSKRQIQALENQLSGTRNTQFGPPNITGSGLKVLNCYSAESGRLVMRPRPLRGCHVPGHVASHLRPTRHRHVAPSMQPEPAALCFPVCAPAHRAPHEARPHTHTSSLSLSLSLSLSHSKASQKAP